jgi:hypothetical protein
MLFNGNINFCTHRIKVYTFVARFMKRVVYIRSFASILMIFFLLASIVCSSITSVGTFTCSQDHLTLSTPNTHSRTDSQLPEKVESENDFKHESNFFFIHQVGDFLPCGGKLKFVFFSKALRFRGNITGIPLYLIQRTIVV